MKTTINAQEFLNIVLFQPIGHISMDFDHLQHIWEIKTNGEGLWRSRNKDQVNCHTLSHNQQGQSSPDFRLRSKCTLRFHIRVDPVNPGDRHSWGGTSPGLPGQPCAWNIWTVLKTLTAHAPWWTWVSQETKPQTVQFQLWPRSQSCILEWLPLKVRTLKILLDSRL